MTRNYAAYSASRARARYKKDAARRAAQPDIDPRIAVIEQFPEPEPDPGPGYVVKGNYSNMRPYPDPQDVGPARLLPGDSGERKTYPLGTGLLDYFPDALAAVAKVSYDGNEKHNPGQPLHWARGKSMDHADCIIRHFIERGGRDAQGNRHSAQLAWRAMALLQQEIETELGLPPPRGTRGDLP